MPFSLTELNNAIEGYVTYTLGKEGPKIPLKLNRQEKKIYEKSIQQGFVVNKGRPNLLAAYSTWCSIKKNPQIVIHPKVKYAHIELDMIFTEFRLSVEGEEKVGQVMECHCPVGFSKYGYSHPGATFSFCEFIYKEQADNAAKKIVQIVNDKRFLIHKDLYHENEYQKKIRKHLDEKNIQYRKIGNKKEGYIYFIQAEDRCIFKIGFSRYHPRLRMQNLQKTSPFDLHLIHYFYSIDCEDAERKVHKYFAETPQRREWFFVSEHEIYAAIEYFQSYIDVALDSNQFDIIDGKYLVLKSEVKEDNITVITEKCPFCGKRHRHGTGDKDYLKHVSVNDGIRNIGHRIAHCTSRNIDFILPDGRIVNNNDGYYLGVN